MHIRRFRRHGGRRGGGSRFGRHRGGGGVVWRECRGAIIVAEDEVALVAQRSGIGRDEVLADDNLRGDERRRRDEDGRLLDRRDGAGVVAVRMATQEFLASQLYQLARQTPVALVHGVLGVPDLPFEVQRGERGEGRGIRSLVAARRGCVDSGPARILAV